MFERKERPPFIPRGKEEEEEEEGRIRSPRSDRMLTLLENINPNAR